MTQRVVLLLILITTAFTGFSQNSEEAFRKSIAVAFKQGNYNTVSNYFNNKIDINIDGNEGVYGKAQAKEILKSFFEKHKPVNSFSTIHNGKSNENLFFSIGKLTCKGGVFRTYLLYQKEGNQFIIKEIRIEPEG
tara:strand:+ start:15018 stop:15422 length:405 start_codon:yes stop_codon:yes gene_type:complete